MNKKKIGFFGGSFDPIHLGHLSMADELMKIKHLDEVWFCPAQISPHKLDKLDHQPASAKDRYEMVRLAIEDYPGFRLLDIEVNRPGPSYTVDTIKELVRKHPEVQFYLMMSDEILPGFPRWKDPEKILSLCELLIGARCSDEKKLVNITQNDCLSRSMSNAVRKGWTPTTINSISSTEIRERIKNKLDISGLVPKKVMDYIYRNHLYSVL